MNNDEMKQLMNQLSAMPQNGMQQEKSGKSIKYINKQVDSDMNDDYDTGTNIKEISKREEIVNKKSTETESDDSLEILKTISESDDVTFLPNETNSYVNVFSEFCLLMVIYYLMSMGTVKNFIGNIMPIINQNDDGSISFIGVILYGLLLCGLFFGLRTLIFKKNI